MSSPKHPHLAHHGPEATLEVGIQRDQFEIISQPLIMAEFKTISLQEQWTNVTDIYKCDW